MRVAAGSVQPWLFDLDLDPDDVAALLRLLDAEERLQFERIRSPRDKVRFAARRGRLRQLLAERMGREPAGLRFTRNRYGKPALTDGEALAFNSSSSGDNGLCVIGDGVEIGCDLEWRDAGLADPGIAERLFSAGEKAALGALPPDQWLEGFFNCWTRKEALLKCIGTGFGEPSDAIEVSLAPGAAARVIASSGEYQLASFAPRSMLHCAVVVAGGAAIEIAEPKWLPKPG